jgi:hypothetical protein
MGWPEGVVAFRGRVKQEAQVNGGRMDQFLEGVARSPRHTSFYFSTLIPNAARGCKQT